MGSRGTKRSSRARKQSGGGSSFLMALGVALAGLAIGVRLSSPPAPTGARGGGSERGREGRGEGVRERGSGAAREHRARRPASPSRRTAGSSPKPVAASGVDGSNDRAANASNPEPTRDEPVHRNPVSSPEPAPPLIDELSPSAPSPSLAPSLPPRGPAPAAVRSAAKARLPRLAPSAAAEIAQGPAAARRIALTFDAGSSAAPTPAILAALREEGLRCTFFLTGRWTERYPDVVRRIAEEGHELGNHTYSHPDLTRLPDAQVLSELQRTEQEVRRVTGRSTKPYFRPPFGARDARVLRLAAAEGYRCVYWSTDSWDSVRKGIRPHEIRERVLRKARPGHIVLMHCGSQATADALPNLLRSLKDEGYELVTLSELLEGGEQ